MGLRDIGYSETLKTKTGKHIARIEDAIRRELNRHSWSRLYGPLKYSAEGGKRIRPLVLLLSGESAGNKGEDMLAAAVAVELLHTESIIHDDIIDQAVLRRRRPAFHIKYGYGTSMLTADFVFGVILEIASRYSNPRVAQELSTASLRMCEGEYWETKIDPETYRLSKEEYVESISLKTASLFQASAKIGGIIGGGTEEEISALSSYGLQLGIAYQLQDDVLDWGEEGKVTSCLVVNSKKTEEIPAYLVKLAKSYAGKAKQELRGLPESDARSCLEELAEFSATHP